MQISFRSFKEYDPINPSVSSFLIQKKINVKYFNN